MNKYFLKQGDITHHRIHVSSALIRNQGTRDPPVRMLKKSGTESIFEDSGIFINSLPSISFILFSDDLPF